MFPRMTETGCLLGVSSCDQRWLVARAPGPNDVGNRGEVPIREYPVSVISCGPIGLLGPSRSAIGRRGGSLSAGWVRSERNLQ